MSRKNGCPFSVKDYQIEILNTVLNEYKRVKGLDSISVDVDADTDDGKAGDAIWAESFITGRSVSGSLEGRPIADRTTGAKDAGQDLLHKAAFNDGGCDNDQTIRIYDAVGRGVQYDCIITSESTSADEDGESISWDWEGVGKPTELEYTQVTGVSFKKGLTTTTSVSITAGQSEEVTVDFAPTGASNKRFGYYVDKEEVARVISVDDQAISIQAVASGTATLTVKTMNNNKTAELAITVTSA